MMPTTPGRVDCQEPSTADPLLDLIQEGNIGLMKAVSRSTGAWPQIFHARRWIRRRYPERWPNTQDDRGSDTPSSMRNKVRRENKLRVQNGAEPTMEEIAAETGCG